jgi:hypothetical protein
MVVNVDTNLIQRAIDSANRDNDTDLQISSIKSANITTFGITLETNKNISYFVSWEVIKLDY